MDSQHRLYRKRFIPQEMKELKDDRILRWDDEIIITSWNSFRPRPDLATGFSIYFRKEGFKISRIYDKNGSFVRWYCDIVFESETTDGLIFSDLLIDVIIESDHSVHVVDLDEAADAFTRGLITSEQLTRAMHITDRLLRMIRHGGFDQLVSCLQPYLNEPITNPAKDLTALPSKSEKNSVSGSFPN